jgi:transcription initiation factor IIE alpha subunit
MKANPARRQEMHVNSLMVYFQGERQWFTRRELAVLEVIEKRGHATDREVMIALGFVDPNAVRPRITKLRDDGVIEEVDTIQDPVTKKAVRVVSLKRDPFKAQALFRFYVTEEAVAK